MSRPVADRIAAAIRNELGVRAGDAELCLIATAPWQSITFAGARTRLALRLAGAGADEAYLRLRHRLDAAEVEIHGHWLADVAWTEIGRDRDAIAVELELLTVELEPPRVLDAA